MHEALTRMLGYLRVDSKNFPLLSDAADLALQCGEWEIASELVQRALDERPDDAVSRYRRVIVLLHERRHREAVAMSGALLNEGNTQPALKFAHARALVMGEDYAPAESFLTLLMGDLARLEDYPTLPHLYIRTLHALGRTEEAIEVANRHLTAHPGDVLAKGMTSLLYFDQGDVDQANRFSEEALAHSPENADALLAAGSVALAREQDDQAKDHFNKLVSMQPDGGRAWLGLGMAEMRGNRMEEARESLQKAIACMPHQLATYNILAWLDIFRQDYAAARTTLEQCLSQDRNFGETHGTLAVLAAIEDDWDEAAQRAETAVRLDAESFAGRYAQTLLLKYRGQTARSDQLLAAILKGADLPWGGTLFDAMQRFAARQ